MEPKHICPTCTFQKFNDADSCHSCHQYCNWQNKHPVKDYPCETCDAYYLEEGVEKCSRKKNLINCDYENNYLWRPKPVKPQPTYESYINAKQLIHDYENFK
jgi:hypothetical protein